MSFPTHPAGARVAPSGGADGMAVVTVDSFDELDLTASHTYLEDLDPDATRMGTSSAAKGPALFPAPLRRGPEAFEPSDSEEEDGFVPIAAGSPGSPPGLPPANGWEPHTVTANTSESSGFKRWIGTINNPSEHDIATFRPGVYGMGQLECGEMGTPHFQFFCVLDKTARLSAMKKLHARAYWAPMKGSIEQCEAYCSKDDTAVTPLRRFTWGERPVGRGKRTDLMDVADLVLRGGAIAVARDMPWAYIKYSRGIRDLAAELPLKFAVEEPPAWHDWQKTLLELLATAPDNRSILWYVDGTGGAGKSTVVRTVCGNEKPCTAVSLSGKVADMAFAYKGEKAVFFDVSRTMAENVKHLAQFAEQLKNGLIFSTKYESRTKMFPSPHVVFFANIMPPDGLWSADRLKLTVLSPAPEFSAVSPALGPPSPTYGGSVGPFHAKRQRLDAVTAHAANGGVHKCAEETCHRTTLLKYKYCTECM